MGKDDSEYDEEEAQRRFEQAVRGGLKTPPTPLKDKPKRKTSPPPKRPRKT